MQFHIHHSHRIQQFLDDTLARSNEAPKGPEFFFFFFRDLGPIMPVLYSWRGKLSEHCCTSLLSPFIFSRVSLRRSGSGGGEGGEVGEKKKEKKGMGVGSFDISYLLWFQRNLRLF